MGGRSISMFRIDGLYVCQLNLVSIFLKGFLTRLAWVSAYAICSYGIKKSKDHFACSRPFLVTAVNEHET